MYREAKAIHVCPLNFFMVVDIISMHRSRKFCQRGSSSDGFFLVDEGRENLSTTKSGP